MTSSRVFRPLLHDGGSGAQFADDQYATGREPETYTLLGPSEAEGELLVFGPSRRVTSLTWHEFSHSVVTPFTKNSTNRLAAYLVTSTRDWKRNGLRRVLGLGRPS